MKVLSLLVLFSIKTALAAKTCESYYAFTIEGKKKELCLHDAEKVLVSKDCETKKCEALKSFHQKKFKAVSMTTKELLGGKNPSTLLCKKINGKLILGISELKHEEYFCVFPDKSYISTSSLYDKYQSE